jgi:uncharacterized membrane protein YidH (DUF202 family)
MTPAGPMFNGADGASAERTRLAWRRTALTSTAIALLAIRVASVNPHLVLSLVGIGATAAGWLAQMWLAHRRIQAMSEREPVHVRRSLPATALITAGMAVLGAALVLTGAVR